MGKKSKEPDTEPEVEVEIEEEPRVVPLFGKRGEPETESATEAEQEEETDVDTDVDTSNVVTLFDVNPRDPVGFLRYLADLIEADDPELPGVGEVAVVTFGDTLEIFGMGKKNTWVSTGLLLHAGFLRISNQLESHGLEEG